MPTDRQRVCTALKEINAAANTIESFLAKNPRDNMIEGRNTLEVYVLLHAAINAREAAQNLLDK